MTANLWTPRAASRPTTIREIQTHLQCHPLTAEILVSRGFEQGKEAERFFADSLRDLPDPKRMRGMDIACERIRRALQKKERIVIYGDYDVDGVTSTSTLFLFLRELGHPAEGLHFFIPHRVEHGYGLQHACIPAIQALGCDLLITVDCGISSRSEVQALRNEGIDVIIIDHHIAPAELPEANAILNPHQPGCGYPDKRLCAVGVTFNLLIGLRAKMREAGAFATRAEPNLKRYLDLVALGTVADIVDLIGVNRIFVREGLKQMLQTEWLGLGALIETARVKPEGMTARALGFQLGPRINAAGRMSDASVGVQLLTTQDPQIARRLSLQLDLANVQRQETERQITQQARSMLQQSPDLLSPYGIVLAHDGWHHGVIGIVAARILEEYHRPTWIIAVHNQIGKGSGRSIKRFHLYEGLDACRDLLVRFGGHKAAAGLTIEAAQIPAFRTAFLEVVRQRTKPEDLVPSLEFDAEFEPEKLGADLMDELDRLEPHGMGNPTPLLVARKVGLESQRLMGAEQQHIQCSLASAPKIRAVLFRQKDLYPLPNPSDIAYQPQWSLWQGRKSIEIVIKKAQAPQGLR